MVRRLEEGSELGSAHARISGNAMPSRGMIAVAIVASIESRVADRGGSRRIEGSGSKPAVPSRLFSCGGPETGRSGVGLRWGGVDGA
jgi:hypothetical protein